MRELHALVQGQLKRSQLRSLEHAYVWNDSVLLLGYVDSTPSSSERCLRDAERLKRKVDEWTTSWASECAYAIAVKGQAFPQQPQDRTKAGRVTVLRASSYAMGNCFLIEKKAKSRGSRSPGTWTIVSYQPPLASSPARCCRLRSCPGSDSATCAL